MDFSFANDWDKKEILIPVIDESRQARNKGGMEVCQNGIEANTEFWWPIQHPIEPADEDQPVKCPMSDSSVIDEEQFSDSLRKRTELSAVMNREGIMVLGAEPARAVRKRHHTSTYGDHTNSFTANVASLSSSNPKHYYIVPNASAVRHV